MVQKQILPFQVYYEGGVRSWEVMPDKKPLAFLFGGYWIILHVHDKPLFCTEAAKAASRVKFLGVPCQALPTEDLFILLQWQTFVNIFLKIIGVRQLRQNYWALHTEQSQELEEKGLTTYPAVEVKDHHVYTNTCYASDHVKAYVLSVVKDEDLYRCGAMDKVS